jgi:ATP-binding cassette, subfamily B, bacterial
MFFFPFYKQYDAMDCGPTCLQMIGAYYGKHFSLNTLRQKSGIGKNGVSLLGISEAAESIGFSTIGVKLSYDQLLHEAKLPCIVHWGQNHFVIVVKKKDSKWRRRRSVVIADPAQGIMEINDTEFLKNWISDQESDQTVGIALVLEPTQQFYQQEGEKNKSISWAMLWKYVEQHKRYLVQLFMAMSIGTLLLLFVPFITQSIVDNGINTQNLEFIHIILIAQFMLFFGRTVVEFIRGRILLFMSTRISLSLLSAFWAKLTRLPLSFFDTKMTGDILQRIGDQRKIESFLTGSTLSVLFSMVNLGLFSIILLGYNGNIFVIFTIGSILYFLWIRLFLPYRRALNHRSFAIASKENNLTMQFIQGMQEIKINNAEHLRRWEWENVQRSLFKISFEKLSLEQYQQVGALFINEGKNILITYIVAKAVLDGQMTLGAMMAIQYIIGQINNPVEQLVGFVQQAQDFKISLERLNEIHRLEDEEPLDKNFLTKLPECKSINIKSLSFAYPGAGNEPVLSNVSFSIPEGKITAIVGMSGSGKTTLIKLLLQFYNNYNGHIRIGSSIATDGAGLKNISPRFWRQHCGCVLQDGYIFNDTIAKNIAVCDDVPDYQRLIYAAEIANILPFIESLPLGFNTQIGAQGNGISAGQKQRILIARTVYKDPEYIFFDEATNALDADNEKEIMEKLNKFFRGKTVIMVAHRLSTVKNADKIIVLEQGEIIEEGDHNTLTRRRKRYFELVKNQLELGI